MKREERLAKGICSKTFSFMGICESFIPQCFGFLPNLGRKKISSISLTQLLPLRSPLLAYWCLQENILYPLNTF